jgi:hypothetical protein
MIQVPKLLLALVALAVIALALVAGVILEPPGYEYAVFSVPDEQLVPSLNKIGAQGWEVISARRAVESRGSDASYEMILRRQARRLWFRYPPASEVFEVMLEARQPRPAP